MLQSALLAVSIALLLLSLLVLFMIKVFSLPLRLLKNRIVQIAFVLFILFAVFFLEPLFRRDPYLWKTFPLLRSFQCHRLLGGGFDKGILVGMRRALVRDILGAPENTYLNDCWWVYSCQRFPSRSGTVNVYFTDGSENAVVKRASFVDGDARF